MRSAVVREQVLCWTFVGAWTVGNTILRRLGRAVQVPVVAGQRGDLGVCRRLGQPTTMFGLIRAAGRVGAGWCAGRLTRLASRGRPVLLGSGPRYRLGGTGRRR